VTASEELILTIDNGTQSVKALLFSLDGNLIAHTQVKFEPYFSEQPGWAEQDPELFWGSLCKARRKLLSNQPQLEKRIIGVSITTQRATVINLDTEGRPLRPAILWLDQRKSPNVDPLTGPWNIFFRLVRLHKTVRYFQAEAEANWIKIHQPDVWTKTAKYLLLSGYLTYRLIGRYVDSVGSQVGYIPFNYKKLRWAGPFDWKWRCMPVEEGLLPKLIQPGQVMGKISGIAAKQTGIPKGLPLIAAAADKACEVVGSGGFVPSIGCISYGTAATINVTLKKYIEPIPLLPAFPSAIPGYHTAEVLVSRGYWMVNWFKKEFGLAEQLEAKKHGLEPEVLFEKFLERTPACSMGLVLWPYWTPGIKYPGPAAKGAIIGFGDIHNRAHIYRAIIEGIAFALREGKERIEKRSGIPITSLRVSGGGSRSAKALQLTADIFGLPTLRPTLYETSGLGAAVDAAVGLGCYPDFKTAVSAMTDSKDIFEPDPVNHRMYDDLYRQVYKHIYHRLKPLNERIRQITGYP
jgi:sugar (pentulose or hexulose) kinase